MPELAPPAPPLPAPASPPVPTPLVPAAPVLVVPATVLPAAALEPVVPLPPAPLCGTGMPSDEPEQPALVAAKKESRMAWRNVMSNLQKMRN